MESFTKARPAGPGAYSYEAAGLDWLSVEGGVPVVLVLSVDDRRIELARLPASTVDRRTAGDFGRRLAVTHDAGAPAFGSPPGPWRGDGWIGDLPLTLEPAATWGAFYAQQRCLPYVRTARDRGLLSPTEAQTIERVLDKVAAGTYDDGAPPARIHGDLWSGNAIPTPDGITLIDPAAHGGHRLTDLAMLSLFGFPHLGTMLDAYESASDHLPRGWRDLILLHQLHPLLVHTVLFGGEYGAQALRAASGYGA